MLSVSYRLQLGLSYSQASILSTCHTPPPHRNTQFFFTLLGWNLGPHECYAITDNEPQPGWQTSSRTLIGKRSPQIPVTETFSSCLCRPVREAGPVPGELTHTSSGWSVADCILLRGLSVCVRSMVISLKHTWLPAVGLPQNVRTFSPTRALAALSIGEQMDSHLP